ncbi:type I restriction enzyme, S subunit [Geoalkalibacter ferrihydriticus]|uniref:Type I restriction modification DNA specificity domain-containing protein n=2 Tax=Geoalkalibacter ferrihydriticus TaxID=392333 RepID=A0A0C2HRZ1_9BACT|nr:restriction endonuclease subunit S [Geoalkalibacter ferrihydriticus]KIH77590.1 hypothetical protein GFER_02595 [Geoalkalibacter ferrihydriticus DSM 17813]SDL69408.1 type I restriction enzyme, S subunit [Geoalkalibacter ferrihydriticus]
MGGEWQESFLTDLYEIGSGLSKPAKDFGSGYPFLAFKDVFNNFFLPETLTQLVQSSEKEQEKCSVKRGDVFLTRTSETMDELGMSSVSLKDYEKATFNGFTKRLRPKEGNCLVPEYVGYFLRSQKFRRAMLAFSTMSTRASLNNGMISRLKISHPSIQEQRTIAYILKTLDDKIELNRQMNVTLEAMAQALFKSWFVDFDPVIDNALAAGNPIPEELQARADARAALGDKRKPLPEAIQKQFPSRFVFTEVMGWVPEGWNPVKLGDYVTVKRGGSPRPIHDYLVENGLPWVKISDATASSSRFIMSTKQYIKPEGLKKTVMLKKGELILSNSATPGLPMFLNLDACIHDGWLFFPKKRWFGDLYLYQLFLVVRSELLLQGNGSVFTNLKTDILKNHLVVMPGESILKEVEIQLRVGHRKSLLIQEEIESLVATRDTLLPKLLSGELRLPDAEKLAAEAV